MLRKANKKIHTLGKITTCLISIINRTRAMADILRIQNTVIYEVKLVYKFC